MPIERKPHATSVVRRTSASHPSPNRPVMSAATAKENGIVNPTYPRYSIGGWNAISGWFCSNAFGPRPSKGTRATFSKGCAGPSISAKKKSAIASPTIVAHATNGSVARSRNFQTVNAR